jgi:hypothetical protein
MGMINSLNTCHEDEILYEEFDVTEFVKIVLN